MLKEFKAFLIKQNMLALAIAVVLGVATNDLVQGIVNDFIMPVVNAMTPGSNWQTATVDVGSVKFLIGHFLSVLLKFVVIGFVCWRLTLLFVKPPKPNETPATRDCPFCRENIDARATRCSHCTSQLTAAA
jgi:large conductance mechanosensitive channel